MLFITCNFVVVVIVVLHVLLLLLSFACASLGGGEGRLRQGLFLFANER